jgi:hypothetical protein
LQERRRLGIGTPSEVAVGHRLASQLVAINRVL